MAVILIVEDDVFISDYAEMILQDFGHHPHLAGDVEAALSVLQSSQHFDVLFTDIQLRTAVLGGCLLAHQAVKLRPGIRVLYTTGGNVCDKLKAEFVEGARVLRKPYSESELRNSLEDLLAT
jgi:CheY-like chemotaxis protein